MEAMQHEINQPGIPGRFKAGRLAADTLFAPAARPQAPTGTWHG
jgi:hypothetical protein